MKNILKFRKTWLNGTIFCYNIKRLSDVVFISGFYSDNGG